MQNNKPKLYNPRTFDKPSLNRQVRKTELTRITHENQAILMRLQSKTATYSVSGWEVDFKRKEKMKENMMEHPYEIGVGASRSRALLTSANLDPADPAYRSVPRVQTAHSGIRTKSYNSL